jgi:1-acyl-sn-glycerol-3-phosphate acyltransferase
MEDRQIQQYSFFQKIGAFSINRQDPRKAVTSLRYAVESMQRSHSCLFIYPEGNITPAASDLSFEGGLAWLHSKLPNVDFVPIGIYMHTIRSDKPELHLLVGGKVNMGQELDKESKTNLFEQKLTSLLEELHQTAGFDDDPYERLV